MYEIESMEVENERGSFGDHSENHYSIATSDICHAFLLIRVHIGEGETLSFHKIFYRYTKTKS